MLGRLAAAAALIALASCANMEPAGRNAARSQPEPIPAAPSAPRASAPISPPPAYTPPLPQTARQTQTTPPVAASSVSVAPPPPSPSRDADADVTVQAPARQVEAPRGDPRSVAERREDIQTWDRCVLAVQQTYASDPTEPELETPEDVCRHQLGQVSRTAVPTSRLVRPH